jgi:glutamyl-tRNA reductase
LELAREAGATDYFLEKLFLAAITVGKRVRSSVRLTSVKSSVVSSMIELLEKEYKDFSSFRCMVIGNGEIGRLAAKTLKKKGAEVLVTVRNYKTRQVEIPEGCRIIGYKERYEQMADYDLILSATRSPHYTLTYEEGRKLFQDGKRRILVDLAVPRDIEEKLTGIDGIRLYDIDQIGNPEKEEDDRALLQAMELIDEQKKLLQQELNVRGYVDKVELASQNGGEITYRRAEKELLSALEKQDEAALHAAVGQAAKKTLSAVIFSLKKVLPREEWEACVEELEKKLEAF